MLERQRQAMAPRLWPEIPPSKYLCFYPMDRKRGESVNWYTEPMADRQRMMHEHGMIGRRYAGEVRQIISGSIGFDDWEWGVDLFADDPLVFKKLIYEMRFDQVSAVYALFGTFFVGIRVTELGEAAALAAIYGVFSPVRRRRAQVTVEAEIFRRQHLRREDDLAGVRREVLDDVVDRFHHRHLVLLHDDALGEARPPSTRSMTAAASSTVARRRSDSSAAGTPPRAANSASRSRRSGAPPTPAMIHCRTLPQRCSTRLPTAFSCSLPRAQIWSEFSFPRQVSMRSAS